MNNVPMRFGGRGNPRAKFGCDLVWKNDAPTDAFPAQTISVDLSSYDMVMVVARYSTTTARCFSSICPLDGSSGTLLNMGNFASATGYIMLRIFTPSSDGIDFDSARRRALNSSSAASASSEYCVPTYIYGIRR